MAHAHALTRPVTITAHAALRQAQRNLSNSAIDYIMTHGWLCPAAGGAFIVLRHRDIPPEDLRRDRCTRLVGATLFLSDDWVLVTTYRNVSATRHVARKSKRSCRERLNRW